ncbi:MAG TPA: hypothetical protein VI759_05295 [Dehalococcoidia bacterium]|nr:hypothetical protein [Dehalococcoidia bacterium]
MHFIVKATIPNDAGNDMLRSGPKMQELIQKVLGDVKPDAAYFSVADGQRTLFLIVDIAEGYEMVRIAEPLWLGLECDVEVYPAMNVNEFDKAGPLLGSIVSKY